MNIKGSALMWILIILIILAIIIGILIFMNSSGSDGGISSILPGNPASKPPALPS